MQTVDNIKKIYIDSSIAEGKVVHSLLERVSADVRLEWVDDPREILEQYMHAGPVVNKTDLLVYRWPAKFLSSCPGSDGMVCCQYFVINLGVGCLFDCHYCYLQSFLNNPLMTVFGNLEDLFSELDERTRNKNFQFRIGTGEYTDSLALEPLTGLSAHLIEYFAGHQNATLELKTKSENVDSLLSLDHRGHTVLAWSINPPALIETVEPGTASLEERLGAAARAERAGYRLAFHLDPLIYFEGWEPAYHRLIEQVFDYVRPDSVAWISTGSFRYSGPLKEVIQTRFPEDRLTRQELVAGPDGKHRYFRSIRAEMFRSIKGKIESVDPRLFLYLCMETQKMWSSVFGFVPGSGKNLDALFEKRRLQMESLSAGPTRL